MILLRYIIPYILLLSLATIFSGCGKHGALIYPDLDTPSPPTAVEATFVGDAIRLQTALQQQGTAAATALSTLQVYRQENPLSQTACSNCSANIPLYSTLYLDHLKNAELNGNLLSLLDTDVKPEHSYFYRLALTTKSGVQSALSEPVTVATVAPVPAPQLTVESTPTEAIIKFIPYKPANGTLNGFSVYKRIAGEPKSFVPYRTIPADTTATTDFMLKKGVKYLYSVRSQIKLKNGDLVESLISNEVQAERIKDY